MRVVVCSGALLCAIAACSPDFMAPDGGSALVLSGDGGAVDFLDGSTCAPTRGPFGIELVDNAFLPLPPGTVRRFEGIGDGGVPVAFEFEVLGDTEQVAGVTTRVVQETESRDGEPVAVARQFVAEAFDGTVCNFGREVGQLDGGTVVSTIGSWRAGVDGGVPGILMPAVPRVGQSFLRGGPGFIEERATNLTLGKLVVTPVGTFSDTLTVLVETPFLPGVRREEVFVRNTGLVSDGVFRLTFQTP